MATSAWHLARATTAAQHGTMTLLNVKTSVEAQHLKHIADRAVCRQARAYDLADAHEHTLVITLQAIFYGHAVFRRDVFTYHPVQQAVQQFKRFLVGRAVIQAAQGSAEILVGGRYCLKAVQGVAALLIPPLEKCCFRLVVRVVGSGNKRQVLLKPRACN